MAQDVIYPGEGSMCTWEKGEIHCFGMKCPEKSIKSNCYIWSFRISVALLIFCLEDLSIDVSGVLKSVIVFSWVYLFMSVSICFIYLGAPT